MSARLVGRALEVKGLDPVPKLILIGLADCTNTATGLCFPSAEWLAGVAGCTERHVRRVIGDLEARGLISIHRRPGKSNLYTVLPTPDLMSPPTPDMRSATPDIAMSATPDIAMSPEPEEPEITALGNVVALVDKSDVVPHHFCRDAKTWADGPAHTCGACGADQRKEETV